ncbi:putative importin-beta domain, armadillo-like helical, importin beta family [Helianthus annuus]|nr:putative importin-beta domain, armadillo-like helical, importin beta family [Helianthus annuus]
MAVEITQFLLAAQSADTKVRTDAEGKLRQFQEQNLPGFLLSLSLELSNDGKPMESRRLAGIVLKNSLDAKDATTKEHLVQQWMSNDASFRSQVKGLLLNTLGSSVPEAGHTAAYETLNEVVRCSNIAESSQLIAQLLPVIMNKLGQTIELQILSSDDREKQGDLQALLCGVMQVIIQKLSSTDVTKQVILQAADQIMVLFLKVFACRSSTVHEEAMLAIGALAYGTGPQFEKYMPEFYKYLEMGLQNFEEYQVCSISVGVVGDICRALDDKMLPYCDNIMTLLLKDLSSGDLHRSVKPPIFSCFGDVALAIGEHFEKYVSYAVPMMQGAAEVCAQIDNTDEEMVEYGNQLKRSIFEAYSGILQGFKSSKAEIMLPHAPHLLKFIEVVVKDANRDESVVRAAVAVLGDLADALGPNVKVLFKDMTFCSEFLGECLQSEDEQLKETATWTQGMIGRVFSVCG